jgi:hypothetical protein
MRLPFALRRSVSITALAALETAKVDARAVQLWSSKSL